MSDSNQRWRQYAGLAFVIVAYVGGIVGWSWAVFAVDPEPSSPGTTHTQVELPPSSLTAVPIKPESTLL